MYNGKQEKAVGKNLEVPKEMEDKQEKDHVKDIRSTMMHDLTASEAEREHQTNFFNNDPVFQPSNNMEIGEVVLGKKMLKREYTDRKGQKQSIEMKSNSHVGAKNMNLIMIYHPRCKFSTDLKKYFAELSHTVAEQKVKLNVIAINDGLVPEYRKFMPGNVQITYYPMVLLFKNDA